MVLSMLAASLRDGGNAVSLPVAVGGSRRGEGARGAVELFEVRRKMLGKQPVLTRWLAPPCSAGVGAGAWAEGSESVDFDLLEKRRMMELKCEGSGIRSGKTCS
jgi:hypothetical protein